MERISRRARSALLEALGDTRVVALLGARQVGKSTLGEEIAEEASFSSIVTLDDQVSRSAAQEDPTGFVAGLARPVFIDEVQRAPDLLLAIKQVVDRDGSPGQFLLTGSANLRTAPTVSEALPGRMEVVRLFPLAQAEIENASGNFVDALFAGGPPDVRGAPVGRAAFVDRVIAGGYPEARVRSPARRAAWYRDYIETLVQRDLKDLADLARADQVPRLLRLLAAQVGNRLSVEKAARELRMSPNTARAYLKLLEDLFLVQRVRPWTPSIRSREVQTPKLYMVDSGLLCHLLGADASRVADDDQVTGKALESFCGMEILKHAAWSHTRPDVYHYAHQHGEVDVVLERADGAFACVEIKAAASVRPRDYAVIAEMRDHYSDRFRAGVVLYSGEQTVPLSDRIWAVPISGLWQ